MAQQTDLRSLGIRQYDPAIGRFISPDPIFGMNEAAQPNRYAYAFNRPLSLIDPSGAFPYGDSPELVRAKTKGDLVEMYWADGVSYKVNTRTGIAEEEGGTGEGQDRYLRWLNNGGKEWVNADGQGDAPGVRTETDAEPASEPQAQAEGGCVTCGTDRGDGSGTADPGFRSIDIGGRPQATHGGMPVSQSSMSRSSGSRDSAAAATARKLISEARTQFWSQVRSDFVVASISGIGCALGCTAFAVGEAVGFTAERYVGLPKWAAVTASVASAVLTGPAKALAQNLVARGLIRNAGTGAGQALLTQGTRGFATGELAIEHFAKHGSSIMRATGRDSYNLANYLDDANFVIQNGTWVPELNGYVRLLGGTGAAKAAFVGVDRISGAITTLHVKTVEYLSEVAPSLGWIK